MAGAVSRIIVFVVIYHFFDVRRGLVDGNVLLIECDPFGDMKYENWYKS